MRVSPELFKQGMRRLTASVCVITTKDTQGIRHGITATAVCSVTADPPTLLCCMNRSNTSYEAFRNANRFAVNVLSTNDTEIAGRFASKLDSEERFTGAEWVEAATGSPILVGAAVGFDCRTSQLIEAGTHTIFIGEIADIIVAEGGADCLLYGDGVYGAFNAR